MNNNLYSIDWEKVIKYTGYPPSPIHVMHDFDKGVLYIRTDDDYDGKKTPYILIYIIFKHSYHNKFIKDLWFRDTPENRLIAEKLYNQMVLSINKFSGISAKELSRHLDSYLKIYYNKFN